MNQSNGHSSHLPVTAPAHIPVADWDSPLMQYKPAAGTQVRTCHALIRHVAGAYFPCGASYLDDPPGRAAHFVVFEHPPVSETS